MKLQPLLFLRKLDARMLIERVLNLKVWLYVHSENKALNMICNGRMEDHCKWKEY
jgi:hypothetical protein